MPAKSPIELAAETYREGERPFTVDLGLHLKHGYVWSSPECFIMARPIDSADAAHILDIEHEAEQPDCWFVWLGAGKRPFRRFLELMPFELPRVGWHNKKRKALRLFPTAQFRRMIYGH